MDRRFGLQRLINSYLEQPLTYLETIQLNNLYWILADDAEVIAVIGDCSNIVMRFGGWS